MRVHLRRGLFWAAIPLLAACSGGGSNTPSAPEGTPRELPMSFALTGTARSTAADGTTVDCLLELFFDLSSPRRSPGMIEYPAVHGGSIRRTVLDAAGDGISLWPHVHGDALVRSIAPDRIEISIPVNADTTSRFWRELSFLAGSIDTDATAAGGWTCAPFDIDEGGWVDETYSAAGTWRLQPTSLAVPEAI